MNLHYFAKYIRSASLTSLFPIFLFICGLGFFITDISCLDSFPLDDAWIHRVYAQSFAFGRGFEYNPGVQETGATSPLWAIVSAPVHWLEPLGVFSVVLAVKILGVFLGIIILCVLQKMTERVTGSTITACIAAALFAFEPRFLFSALSGMETLLLVALWLSACYLVLMRQWVPAMVLLSLTSVTRPEALLIAPIGIGLLLFYGKQVSWPKKLCLTAFSGIPFGAWSLFCYFTTGHWLPNTFYVKAQSMPIVHRRFLPFAWKALTEHGYAATCIFLIGLGMFVLLCLAKKSTENGALLLLAPFLYLFGVVGTRFIALGGYYYWSRWIDPAALLLTASFCMGYALLLSRNIALFQSFRISLPRSAGRWAVFAAIICLVIALPSFVETFQNRRFHLASDSRAIYLINMKAGLWIHEHVPADARIGANDAGAIRYFGKRHTVDLLGLNNKEIAFHQKQAVDYFKELDWLAIFPSWFPQFSEIIHKQFTPQEIFQIPQEEYTICHCPGQEKKIVFKKKE